MVKRLQGRARERAGKTGGGRFAGRKRNDLTITQPPLMSSDTVSVGSTAANGTSKVTFSVSSSDLALRMQNKIVRRQARAADLNAKILNGHLFD